MNKTPVSATPHSDETATGVDDTLSSTKVGVPATEMRAVPGATPVAVRPFTAATDGSCDANATRWVTSRPRSQPWARLSRSATARRLEKKSRFGVTSTINKAHLAVSYTWPHVPSIGLRVVRSASIRRLRAFQTWTG